MNRPARLFRRLYGEPPWHLIALAAGLVVCGYAADRLLARDWWGVVRWFVGGAVLHDLVLVPLYGGAYWLLHRALRTRGDAVAPPGLAGGGAVGARGAGAGGGPGPESGTADRNAGPSGGRGPHPGGDPRAEPGGGPDAGAEGGRDPRPDAEPDAGAGPEHGSTPHGRPRPRPEDGPDATSGTGDPRAEPESDRDAEGRPSPQPDGDPYAEPGGGADAEPSGGPGPHAGGRPPSGDGGGAGPGGPHAAPTPERLGGRPLAHLRVPAFLSLLLLLVYWPSISQDAGRNYERVTLLSSGAFVVRWLLITAALFFASGLLFAVRVLRARTRPRPPRPPGPVRPSDRAPR